MKRYGQDKVDGNAYCGHWTLNPLELETLYDRVVLRPVSEEAGPRPLGLHGHLLVMEGQEAGGVEVEEGEGEFASP